MKRSNEELKQTTKVLKYFSTKLKENSTAAEKKFSQLLKLCKIDFIEQYPFTPKENVKYIIDFYIPSAKLAIEIDGGYHTKNSQAKKDKHRDSVLNGYKIKTLRFTNSDVFNNEQDVAYALLDEYNKRLKKNSKIITK